MIFRTNDAIDAESKEAQIHNTNVSIIVSKQHTPRFCLAPTTLLVFGENRANKKVLFLSLSALQLYRSSKLRQLSRQDTIRRRLTSLWEDGMLFSE